MKEEMAVVYMAAGLSSRFGGKAKQLVEVGPNGERLMEISIQQAIKGGAGKIIIIIGEKTESLIRGYFGDSYRGVPISYAKQEFNPVERDKPWGTTDALCSAKNLVDCPFVVCNGDDIYGEETFRVLFNHLKSESDCAVIGYKLINCLPEKGKVNRAVFEIDKFGYATGLKEIFEIEKTDLKGLKEDSLISMNIYALYPEHLAHIVKELERFKKENERERTKECLLPNIFSKLAKEQKIKIRVYPALDKPIGITSPGDEESVKAVLKGI